MVMIIVGPPVLSDVSSFICMIIITMVTSIVVILEIFIALIVIFIFIILVIVIIILDIIFIIIIIIITRPWPAFGRQGLVGSSGGYTYHGYPSHVSPRACGARLGRKVSRNGRNVISPIYRHF